MPNWVSNEIIIDGPPTALDAIRTALSGGQSLMDAFVPLDDRYTETKTTGNGVEIGVFADGGYEAAKELWGTKWGDCETRIARDDGTRLHITFQTAWTPLDAGLRRLSAVLPVTIGCACIEEQPEFLGWFIARDGEIVAERWDSGDAFYDALPELNTDASNWDEVEEARHDNEDRAFETYHREMADWLARQGA